MAPEKRKREANALSDRNEKKSKLSSGPQIATSKEETPFPRGGGGVLTPLEHRQIQNQAKRDVLFEEGTGRKAPKHDFEDEENEPAVATRNVEGISKRTKKSHNKVKAGEPRRQSDARVHIDSLSYKRLVPGFTVLGQVAQINRDDITLNLPDNLSGYVPLTSISDVVIENLVDSTEDSDIQLDKLFFVGQYLRAYVVSTQESSSNKRHIELSIKPQHANQGLTREDCVEKSMIQASVASVEDRGIIMDLGLKDKSVRGFISSKRLGSTPNTSVGSVHLCFVTENSGKTIKLSMEPPSGACVKSAPNVHSVLPGTAIEVLVSDLPGNGVAGKFMGLVDVTADLFHSGIISNGTANISVGGKVTGRIISASPASDEKRLGISLLDHVAQWKMKTSSLTTQKESATPTSALPVSAIVENARVTTVEPDLGLFLDVHVEGVQGFVHISKISDGKIESLSESTGLYKIGSTHKARVLGYNMMDGLYILSLEPSVINQPFLHMEDVKVGESVKGKFEKFLLNEEGIVGALVELAKGVTGMIPEMHFADIRLQHPERKFKEGSNVTARVLSVDLAKRRVRLTMKKSLVNSDAMPWITYDDLTSGMQSPGTLVNILPHGAVVQFYGHVRAFLPVAEMSESFIRDPKEHFQKGQVVNVRILSVNAEEERLVVSCKDPVASTAAQQMAINSLKLGQSVSGKVIEKTAEEIILDLDDLHGVRGNLPFEHLTDGSAQKALSLAKQVRVGQNLSNVIVLYAHTRKNGVGLTSKPSLVKAAKEGRLAKSLDDLEQGSEVTGYLNNIVTNAIFVRFAGDLTGLLPRQNLPEEALQLPNFGYRRNQSISVTVMRLDRDQSKIILTKRAIEEPSTGQGKLIPLAQHTSLSNPVDEMSTTIKDYDLGKITRARVVSVKETQLNVQLADGVQGRIDMSEIFNNWSEIKDRKHPLKVFHAKQVLPVRVLGMHDSRNHRFLPISHRQGRVPVFELTAKASALEPEQFNVLSMDQIEVGSSWLAFVNNVNDDYLWVNLSPNVRGRIRLMDVSDDISLLKDMSKNFPVGSALRVSVVSVDVDNNRLDLSARSDGLTKLVTLQDLSPGMVLPGRVTKVTDRQIMIQLNENLSGSLHLIDMTDDFGTADSSIYQKNQTVRVCIKDVDRPNKRISFSTRPSRVLSSSLPIRDRDVTSISQLNVNDVVRGFTKNITDQGIFVSLSSSITAFVRVSDLSDGFVKDWKSQFEVDRLVEGRLIAVDVASHRVQMSLKKSQLDDDYKPPITFMDLEVGQVVSGKIRKVEDFGVFVVIDNSANVSGLCHRSQISDKPSANPKALYEEGDMVKAKVLNIDPNKRRISFGLRASYFSNSEGLELSSPADSEDGGAELDPEDADMLEDDGSIRLAKAEGLTNQTLANIHPRSVIEDDVDDPKDRLSEAEEQPVLDSPADLTAGLGAGGFDWTGGLAETQENNDDGSSLYDSGDSDASYSKEKKKKAKKPTIKVDRTGDLDTYGPQTPADFERLLLGQPNASVLWLQYMAFHLQLGEIDSARSVAERALKTIHIRESEEKLNVWIALLNLENAYGTAMTVEAVFTRACQYNDPQEIHERLTSIYIQSGKHREADDLFQATLKKFSHSPALYYNYATFLFTHMDYDAAGSDRARAILPRAMQALPAHEHVGLTSKFAQLEFKHGDPERGRTIFENMVAQWPKRLDLWNVLLDMEIALVKASSTSSSSPPPSSANTAATTVALSRKRKKSNSNVNPSEGDQSKGEAALVRRLFERILPASPSQSQAAVAQTAAARPKLKPKKAKFFFKKWLAFEERFGEVKDVERVKGLATEYVLRSSQS